MSIDTFIHTLPFARTFTSPTCSRSQNSRGHSQPREPMAAPGPRQADEQRLLARIVRFLIEKHVPVEQRPHLGLRSAGTLSRCTSFSLGLSPTHLFFPLLEKTEKAREWDHFLKAHHGSTALAAFEVATDYDSWEPCQLLAFWGQLFLKLAHQAK